MIFRLRATAPGIDSVIADTPEYAEKYFRSAKIVDGSRQFFRIFRN